MDYVKKTRQSVAVQRDGASPLAYVKKINISINKNRPRQVPVRDMPLNALCDGKTNYQ